MQSLPLLLGTHLSVVNGVSLVPRQRKCYAINVVELNRDAVPIMTRMNICRGGLRAQCQVFFRKDNLQKGPSASVEVKSTLHFQPQEKSSNVVEMNEFKGLVLEDESC